MKKSWIAKREGNRRCVLFFNGWGMDGHAVAHLDAEGADVCMFYGYDTLEAIGEDLSAYLEVYLVAWSLGVWASAQVVAQSSVVINKSIAINGTLCPIDADKGIAPAIFEGTLRNWDDRNRKKFDTRVFGGPRQYLEFQHCLSECESEGQKEELSKIKQGVEDGGKCVMDFDVAVVGDKDMIFLPQNQRNSWDERVRVVDMDVPHYPFGAFKSWDDIINL